MNAKLEKLEFTIDKIKGELEGMSFDLSRQKPNLGETSTIDLGHFISRLKGDLKYVTGEFSRLKGNIAEVLAAPTDHDADEVQVEHHGQFGKVTMNIHYTLGNGVARVLGDKVEAAVFRAYSYGRREVGAGTPGPPVKLEVNLLRVGLLVDLRYDREENLCFIHLELCRTQWDIDDENCFF
jgi:hypothetical protein